MEAFESHVRNIYKSLPADKSMASLPTIRLVTIEFPVGVGRKYYPVQSLDDLLGKTFDEVEKSEDFLLLKDCHKLYDSAVNFFNT